METRVPESACTGCGKTVDACSSAFGEHTPKPDDITMCFYCGHIMSFDNELKLRDLSVEEWQEIKLRPDVNKLREAFSKRQ